MFTIDLWIIYSDSETLLELNSNTKSPRQESKLEKYFDEHAIGRQYKQDKCSNFVCLVRSLMFESHHLIHSDPEVNVESQYNEITTQE